MAVVSGVPIWAYLAVTVPLVLTPGASTAVVLRNSIAGGTRAGVQTAVGINAGSFCYGLLSAFGLSLVLRQWPSLWQLLRGAGGVYLAWLGARSLRAALAPDACDAMSAGPARFRGGLAHAYEGFLTNILNPAIATFYLVILPQFVPREVSPVRAALFLTFVHISLAASWHLIWAAAGGTLAASLSRGRPRRVLDAAAGVALLSLAMAMLLRS
jgi:threonine/homoserine/homoserine lactone efflux protein